MWKLMKIEVQREIKVILDGYVNVVGQGKSNVALPRDIQETNCSLKTFEKR